MTEQELNRFNKGNALKQTITYLENRIDVLKKSNFDFEINIQEANRVNNNFMCIIKSNGEHKEEKLLLLELTINYLETVKRHFQNKFNRL